MWPILLGPVIGAFIGWVTNWLAIQMIFRPYRPIRIPLLHYEIQGLIPRRQAEIARTVGEVIEAELFSVTDMVERLSLPETKDKVAKVMASLAREHLSERLPGFFPAALRGLIGHAMEDILRRETPAVIARVSGELVQEIGSHMDISAIVEEKILRLNLEGLEKLVLSVAARELKHIEVLGALLGFIIGLFQVSLFYLIQ